MFVLQVRHCDQLKSELAHYDRADADDPIKSYTGMFNTVLRILKRKSDEKFRSVEKNKVSGTGGGLNTAAAPHEKGKGKDKRKVLREERVNPRLRARLQKIRKHLQRETVLMAFVATSGIASAVLSESSALIKIVLKESMMERRHL